jgi:hypothetical protein
MYAKNTGIPLTVLIDNQHPRLSSSLLLLHHVRDGVFAVRIKSDVDLTAFVINSGDHCIETA